MRYVSLITLLFIVLIPTFAFSQNVSSFSSEKDVSIVDSFRITLTNDSLSVTLQNKYLPLSDIQQFDAYLKRNHPDLSKSFVFILSPLDIKYEKKKELLDILSKYHNQIISGIIYNSK